jgi:hypothetical protein
MKKPGFLAIALVIGYLIVATQPASAAPFVFPDRPELIFAFPEKTVESWFAFPDGIGFPSGSTNFSDTSLGGGGGGGGGAGSGGGTGTSHKPSDFDTPDPDTFPLDAPFSTLSFNTNMFSSRGPAGTAPGVGFVVQWVPDLPQHTVIIDEPGNPDALPSSPAPEPGSMLLVGAVLAGLVARCSRSARSAAR